MTALLKKGIGKVAGEIDILLVEADVHGKRFDQEFPIVPICRACPRQKKRAMGAVHRRVRRAVPYDVKPGAAKLDCLRSGALKTPTPAARLVRPPAP